MLHSRISTYTSHTYHQSQGRTPDGHNTRNVMMKIYKAISHMDRRLSVYKVRYDGYNRPKRRADTIRFNVFNKR